MTQVSFTTADGQTMELDGADGHTLMHVATAALVPGIIGECGGTCACATCHVYVDAAFLARLPPPSDAELDLLSGVEAPRDNSRLSCQIQLTPALAGLRVEVPAEMY